ncbi:alpha/beta fold hydrolase [Streptacidiphilus rugosus]|uniref:alpha/beta fold hydrolase n=1 Tax=Streptacidiphilus rugosus TaxID=405783 RepID=UPI00055B13CF|nr:alpha/beta hydrolase [Streptacidiphilus rugosus]
MKIRRSATAFGLTAALGATAFLSTHASAASPGPDSAGTTARPTVVLVHGAFADASSWDGVIKDLQQQGYKVVAPANPLRGLPSDSAYLASVLHSIQGPIVLVGHSYGGEVITNAAAGDPQVKALVYIAAIAPDKGESANDILGKFAGSQLPTALTNVSYPKADGTSGTDLYVNPDKFRAAFAGDVPATTAAVMAATQRPIDATALTDKSAAAAWKTIPSWYLVADADKTIPPAAERFMAKRAHAHTIEINSSHAAAVSHPDMVAGLIIDAARSTQK